MLSFRGRHSYVITYFFKVGGYKNSDFFHGCKNIHLICLIYVQLPIKIAIANQTD